MMKTLQFMILLIATTHASAQSPDRKGLDQAIMNYKNSLLKKDFSLLRPELAESYSIGQYKRPQADKIIPQILAQWPQLVEFKVTDTKYYSDRIVVSIDYEYEGTHLHFWGPEKSSSTCTLTLLNKFTTSNTLMRYSK